MYTSIRAELQKARRRHDLIVCLLVPVMALITGLAPSPMMTPLASSTTAPTGTSPRAAASRARSSARRIACSVVNSTPPL